MKKVSLLLFSLALNVWFELHAFCVVGVIFFHFLFQLHLYRVVCVKCSNFWLQLHPYCVVCWCEIKVGARPDIVRQPEQISKELPQAFYCTKMCEKSNSITCSYSEIEL